MILGHKPFLLLADVLTRRGIAVLRCDDRGVGGSTGSFATATTKDFATDVHQMVRYLRSRSDIRHDRIGLIGHSEGGLIAPIVASESKDVAFLVLMAGPSLTGAEIIRMQDSLINAASGASPEQLRRAGELDRKLFEIIQANPDTAVERAQIRSVLLAELRSTNPAPDAEAAGMAGIRGAALTLTTPWMQYFLFYDPAPALRRVTCPVLAIDGSLDLQVPPDTNLHGIERALREGGNTNVRIRNFPGLNHLFQTAKTGLPGEYSSIEETIAPEVLTEIGDWVSARAK
jgi:pimeloyl-ACP methyl ester carboxylesterase